MYVLTDAFLHFLLPLTVALFAFGCLGRVIHRRLVRSSPAPTETGLRTSRPPPWLFLRLRYAGFEVYEQVPPAGGPRKGSPFGELRVAFLWGHESVYMCACCGQRGKFAFGEAASSGSSGTWAPAVWLGHVCSRCGFVDRYRKEYEEGGLFACLLEHGGSFLDVVTALESQEWPTLAMKIQALLAQRECTLDARIRAMASMRKTLAYLTGGTSVHPFRSAHLPPYEA